jgi:hypothetical protein
VFACVIEAAAELGMVVDETVEMDERSRRSVYVFGCAGPDGEAAVPFVHRPVKAMRHTFATWAIESGQIELSYLGRIMGTSVRELEDTYFHHSFPPSFGHGSGTASA